MKLIPILTFQPNDIYNKYSADCQLNAWNEEKTVFNDVTKNSAQLNAWNEEKTVSAAIGFVLRAG